MTMLKILAAGSLRAVWPDLVAAFSVLSGLKVNTDFAPAGLLRQRIEAGEPCDLFASANRQHPEALLQSGRAAEAGLFAANTLSLTIKRDIVTQADDWLSLLCRNDLRLATSMPRSLSRHFSHPLRRKRFCSSTVLWRLRICSRTLITKLLL